MFGTANRFPSNYLGIGKKLNFARAKGSRKSMNPFRNFALPFLFYWFRGVLDVVFPRSCVITGKALEEGELSYICEEGAKLLYCIHAASACPRCGAFLGENPATKNICPNCINRGNEDLQIGRSRSVVCLDSFSRPIVFSLKYWKLPSIARDMAVLATRSRGFVEYLQDAILVPVPLCKKRLRSRGYNQSLCLAKALAAVSSGTCVADVLERTRDTGTQTHLDAEARRENVRGAFVAKGNFTANPKKRYILIDDVFTTGSTLSECAVALRRRGAVRVDAATFAHG